jgi:alpha-galactosidase
MKITFFGAGSTIFARNVLGDAMCSPVLYKDGLEIALYDINGERLTQSETIIEAINKGKGGKAHIKSYFGPENRKAALKGADFAVNAIQVGGYEPATVTDFEIPKKYGLRQTIADTMGIGGIMRALRTIPVVEEFAHDMEEVCPDVWFLNYVNPMAMLTGYIQRYTGVKTVGLCHSVQVCSEHLLKDLGMEDKLEGRRELIAGINHMGWLLKLEDKDGNDLYPEIRSLSAAKLDAALADPSKRFDDMVRYDYIRRLGYYCTESSEHNSEYNPFYIKSRYPELIEKYNIPLDEYPRRCVRQIAGWKNEYEGLSSRDTLEHERSHEFASYIMEAMVSNGAYKIGGNVINHGSISNLPDEACVEVPCLVDNDGVKPCYVGNLPLQCAAMNMTNINAQLLTIEAARTRKVEDIYRAAMLEPHTAAELSLDDIVKMVEELVTAHGSYMAMYK